MTYSSSAFAISNCTRSDSAVSMSVSGSGGEVALPLYRQADTSLTPRQRHQHAWMVACAHLAASGAGHTPESREAFKSAVAQRIARDRDSDDLFARIQSDNRPN